MTFILPSTIKPIPPNVNNERRLENAMYVFAFLNLLTTAFMSIFTVGGSVFWFTSVVMEEVRRPPRDPSDYDALHTFFTYILFGGIIILMVFSLVAFVFSALLMSGLTRRNPVHLKAYFVYGVVVCTVGTIASIAFAYLDQFQNYDLFFSVMSIIVSYSLVLCMIRKTYKGYEEKNLFQCGDNLLIVAANTPEKI